MTRREGMKIKWRRYIFGGSKWRQVKAVTVGVVVGHRWKNDSTTQGEGDAAVERRRRSGPIALLPWKEEEESIDLGVGSSGERKPEEGQEGEDVVLEQTRLFRWCMRDDRGWGGDVVERVILRHCGHGKTKDGVRRWSGGPAR
ncbi:5-formyltetrahydrofolate cyclo-ligase [Sesbania bispinosa]|nr:5-formyltetrahydrofolate cyclo-ligase [Sesbania bispinosa]